MNKFQKQLKLKRGNKEYFINLRESRKEKKQRKHIVSRKHK